MTAKAVPLIVALLCNPALSFALDTSGDALVSASIGEPRTLIPILASDSASSDVTGLLYNGLLKYDKHFNLVGDLAKSWQVTDEGKTIVFHLRRDVLWHDGKPFTAEDVLFTYQALIDPDVPTPYSGDFKVIQTVRKKGAWTVEVTYNEPFAPALPSWTMAIMPQHLLEGENLLATPYARNPIGTGPYQFDRWITAQRVELSANPNYHEGKPKVDLWIYRIIPDASTIFLELQTEGVDLAGLSPLQYRRQTQNQFFQTTYRKFKYPALGFTYLGYNLQLPMFQDRRVRTALNLAINKEKIIQGALLGLGDVATGPFVKDSWAANPAVGAAPYDPTKARELLREAGWIDTDHDGWLDKNGEAFSFTILTNQGNLVRDLTAQIIQRQLANLGIQVKIRIVEWSAFLTSFIHKRRFEAVLLGWALSPDPDLYDIWHSSKTKEGEFNFVGYANPQVDQLLEQARRSVERDQRQVLYHQMHEILYQDQPYCFLYVAEALPILHSRFEGFDPGPAGLKHNIEEWYVPKKRQKYVF